MNSKTQHRYFSLVGQSEVLLECYERALSALKNVNEKTNLWEVYWIADNLQVAIRMLTNVVDQIEAIEKKNKKRRKK